MFRSKSVYFYKSLSLLLIFVAMIVGTFIGPKAFSKDSNTSFFVFNAKAKIKANLGNKSQTRIEMSPHYIKEIIGDSNSYLAVHNSNGRFLYLLPKVSVGEKIVLSVLTTSGKAQDFEFQVTEGEGTTIIVSSKEIQGEDLASEVREVKALLSAMISGNGSKYYVRDFTRKKTKSKCTNCKNRRNTNNKYIKGLLLDDYPISKIFKGFEIREQSVYSYESLGIEGIVLEIKNLSRKKQIINENAFSGMFAGTILVSLENKEILPKMSSKVFIINKSLRGDDDK